MVHAGDAGGDPAQVEGGHLADGGLQATVHDIARRVDDAGVVQHRFETGIGRRPLEAVGETLSELVLAAGRDGQRELVHGEHELAMLVQDCFGEEPVTSAEVVVDEGRGDVEALADLRQHHTAGSFGGDLPAGGLEDGLAGVSVADVGRVGAGGLAR